MDMEVKTSIKKVVNVLCGTTDGKNQRGVYIVKGMHFSESYEAVMVINFDTEGNTIDCCIVNTVKGNVTSLVEDLLKVNVDVLLRICKENECISIEEETSNC